MNTQLNKTDYILLAIVLAVSTLFNLWSYYIDDHDLLEYLVDIPVYLVMTCIILWVFMYWLLPRYLVGKPKYFLLMFFAILILTVAGMIEDVFGFWSGGNEWSKFPVWHKFLLRGLFIGADNLGIPLGILLTKKFYEGQTQVAKIKEQQKENQLKLLRSQLDPHFLFNNLNTLDALIDSDANKAKEYINRLSLIYRYLIQTKDAEIMELSEEMNLAENYIFLIKTRFGSDFDFHINKQADFSNKFLPTGAIQALLENVVKHNTTKGKNTIHVSIEIEENWLTVINKKSKLKGNKDTLGTGLKNLKDRYSLLSEEVPKITEDESEYRIAIPIIKLSA